MRSSSIYTLHTTCCRASTRLKGQSVNPARNLASNLGIPTTDLRRIYILVVSSAVIHVIQLAHNPKPVSLPFTNAVTCALARAGPRSDGAAQIFFGPFFLKKRTINTLSSRRNHYPAFEEISSYIISICHLYKPAWVLLSSYTSAIRT